MKREKGGQITGQRSDPPLATRHLQGRTRSPAFFLPDTGLPATQFSIHHQPDTSTCNRLSTLEPTETSTF